jgi:predicted O-linked N-acetylglucosamine transferase (SPINDLY family)
LSLQQAGHLQQAEALFRQILSAEPNHPQALHFLGMLAQRVGKNEIAAELIRKALRFSPNYIEACFHLGVVLQNLGRMEEAVAAYQRLLNMRPDYLEALTNLGNALLALGRLDEAVASFRQVLTFKPDFAEAHNNLGMSLKAQGKLDEAVDSFRLAMSLKPDFAVAHSNLGSALKDQGNLNEAIASFRQALTLKPNFAAAHSNLLLCLNYLPGQNDSLYFDEACRYGREITSNVRLPFSDWSCSARPDRILVGMVSGDLGCHPVGFFLENLLENLDPAKIELVAYPTLREEDELTARIRSRFVGWKPLTGMRNEAAAGLIHADGVHILLDLSGHTSYNRLPVFAWKPAPVQATWLGYFASTGMSEMDYLIAAPVSVPKSHPDHFTEKIWYLPDTRFCFSPPVIGDELSSAPLPALRNGFITFGCFQNVAKINDAVLAAWGKILQQLPHSRLRLQNYLLIYPTIREQLRERLARNGIAPERVTLEKSVPRSDYLAAHSLVDIILDTFPFPGGTTTCEALWMGVPTVTITGNTMLARQGASLLACAGLVDWIATDAEDYVAKAVAYSTDLGKLAALRAVLRRQVLASPLFDGARFARNFEEAMWGMWRCFLSER